MKTASFFTYQAFGRIAISRAVPKSTRAGYKMFGKLAPGPWFRSVSRPEYERLYRTEILGVLDPQATWDALHKLVYPETPVLLCYERPPFTATNYCHRRMVAEWFKETLGKDVPEFEPVQRQPDLLDRL